MKLQGFKESKGGKEWTSHSRTGRKEREWHRVVLRNDYCVSFQCLEDSWGSRERSIAGARPQRGHEEMGSQAPGEGTVPAHGGH